MGRPASWPPRLTRHKSGRARVSWKNRDYWFGKYGTKEADEAYAEFVRAGPPQGEAAPKPRRTGLTVAEAVERYEQYAERHYRHPDGRETSEMSYVRAASAVLLAACPALKAEAFRGRALKGARDEMVRKGWCRTNVNHHANVVKRMWKWLASEELVSAEAYGSVRSVEALKRGRTEARESPRVLPAPLSHVEAALPFLSPHLEVAARLQLLTACRPGEALALDPAEVERRPGVWLWTPEKHKTAHHGRRRVILVGPQAQALLAPLLASHPGGVLFSPARSEALRRLRVRQGAPTPRRLCLAGRYDLGECYDGVAYSKAVGRACDRAEVPRWTPNQLRHSAATALAERFGWEVTRLVLGHSSVSVTRVYVEDQLPKAIDAIAKAG